MTSLVGKSTMRHIHKFEALSGSNACDDLAWSGADCRRYNLFYGWNGSGKTTLSRIFHTLERGSLANGAPSTLAFHIPVEGGSIRIGDIASHNCSLRVFSEDFVKANVSFESGKAQPILIIGQDNIAALGEISALEKEEERLAAREQALLKERPDNARLTEILTACARDVVAAFVNTPLAGSAFQGRRYTRPQVETRIGTSSMSESNLPSFLLPQEAQDSFRAVVKTEKSPIRATIAAIPDILTLFQDVNALLTTVVESVDMGLLATDRDLREWTETGLQLHSARNATECFFCHAQLPTSLLPSLARLFTNEIGDLRRKLRDSLLALATTRTLRADAPDSGEVYPTISARFLAARNEYYNGIKRILDALDELQAALQARLNRLPDPTPHGSVTPPSSAIAEAAAAVTELNQLISEHNTAVESAAENATKAALALECHVIATRLTTGEYFTKRSKVQRIDALLGPVRDRLSEIGRDLTAKRAVLHDSGIALEQINQHLRRYFRGDDLYLEIDTSTAATGYALKSRGQRAYTLSEGEKSVLALVYFLVKLKEDGCDLANTTIVIDDPVDSQDGPFLYRTFGLIRSELEAAGQLLVFTHNFEFFNLMRDWILDRRTRDHANCYLIEMMRSTNGQRTLSVKELPALLRQYKNEYPYLFAKLYEFAERGTGLEPPIVPNVGRKVLEYFAAFKWACKSSEGLSEIVRTRFADVDDATRRAAGHSILKFVNEYSHGTDFNRPITASVLEAQPIALAVRDFIRVADPEHYDSLSAAPA
jgi:wobble nucleotide-excising tRNase